ncbi:MAG: hypothetical protein KF791_18405 [Verrucomicrobiae bacterium]|nr:hypothetical protein [Verrucomicrobiae bacterium]
MTQQVDTIRGARALLMNTTLYREFQAEKEEILRHKWIESEKAGYDIGFERALVDWITHYRAGWRRARQQSSTDDGPLAGASGVGAG